jgi:hypothetical protein
MNHFIPQTKHTLHLQSQWMTLVTRALKPVTEHGAWLGL